ncbi:L-histidine N(alpha)-methyltransferase [Chitinasiproducens palmae]|uniref:Dimethylhistidine N-methyltransferase n=1 Tax=Chitinasiproducens palmae TaxID=1770053 RepID=A0A1H2PSI4_9BURK|nr:L-histidine N(alpha)-methyltransferase [Chitinasiproducens palmae]SDV49969.1 dimethylhistidine N-methyltransferase [Chitinasiproducens palmae]
MALPAERIAQLSSFAEDVRAGLTASRKTLPSKYLYDAVGSALFEVITVLPEYGVTRAEERLLREHAASMVAHLGATAPSDIVELGSGTGQKTRYLLQALRDAAPTVATVYRPIEISETALQACARNLADIAGLRVVSEQGDYFEGLGRACAARTPGQPLLLLFLGSTIGNFGRDEAVAFLQTVRATLSEGDLLLLGTDLLKPVATLIDAYDDPAGVTAAFDMNLLARINRELGGDFDLRRFRHEARFDAAAGRIEMHLRSLCRQTVRVAAADLTVHFEADETIWTESSHKYRSDDVARLGAEAGFGRLASWEDQRWPFAETLFVAR